jgi:hypothetical protein
LEPIDEAIRPMRSAGVSFEAALSQMRRFSD